MQLYTHYLIYGKSGMKKSRFAAEAPTPSMVWFFDGMMTGMDRPYIEKGEVSSLETEYENRYGTVEGRKVFSREDGSLLYHLIYFDDENPDKPVGWPGFTTILDEFFDMKKWQDYETIILDSITQAELACRWYMITTPEYLKTERKNEWTVRNIATDKMEQILCGRLKSLKRNLIIIGHVTPKTESAVEPLTAAHTIDLMGRLNRAIFPVFSEIYYFDSDEKQKGEVFIVAERGRNFHVKSGLGIPDKTPAHWESVWKAAEKRQKEVYTRKN